MILYILCIRRNRWSAGATPITTGELDNMATKTKNFTNTTVGASAADVFDANGARNRLWIQADSQNSGRLYFTIDGSTPSATNYVLELTAGGALIQDRHCWSGALKVIGSASGQRFAAEEG